MHSRHFRTALAAALLCLPCSLALAQSADCTAVALPDPPRHVVRCPGGLQLTVEAAATYRLLVRGQAAAVSGVDLDGGAVLVDTGGRRPGGFQVRTPHAVASVRGTRFAVDAEAAKSAVFVQDGSVRVGPRAGRGAVTLGAGEGVDVGPGDAPLVVRRWPAERRDRLLARLGE